VTMQAAEQATINSIAPPRWFWVISAIGLVWNLIGVAAFLGQIATDPVSLPPAERAFYESTPAWATAAFAVAVFGGVLGCAALLLRRGWALSMFIASLLGIVVQVGHSVLISNGIEVFGVAGLVLPVLTFTIAVALAWFARYTAAQGWIA
jgi:hypothetical protein